MAVHVQVAPAGFRTRVLQIPMALCIPVLVPMVSNSPALLGKYVNVVHEQTDPPSTRWNSTNCKTYR